MKLNLKTIQNPENWPGYTLPKFDIEAMVKRTMQEPTWLHIGAGNIFRIFPASVQQDLLDSGLSDKGIIVYEGYDEEIIPSVFTPHDNLNLAITLKANNSMEKKVVASIAEAVSEKDRLMEVFTSSSLQMISFTITEKGYAGLIMDIVAEGLLARYKAGAFPLALVSMDNCAKNGDVLKKAVKSAANPEIQDFIDSLAFPWSMIDKITPRPSPEIANLLKAQGYEDTDITTTSKSTWISSFVIGEDCQYLVIEDNFPNGRPPLEKAGVIFTDRETVGKTEKMKVGTCLNPLHTALAISGCLLGYKTISECMKDQHLTAFIKIIAQEGLPVVSDPKVIDPKAFLQDVLEKRLPNPFIPDTPQRIAMDTSQKIPVRFGETLKLRRAAGLSEYELKAIPLFFALWLHYLKGDIEPDPRADELKSKLDNIQEILCDTSIFGIDLTKSPLGAKIEGYLKEISNEPDLRNIFIKHI